MGETQLPDLDLDGWLVILLHVDHAFGLVLQAPEGSATAHIRIGGTFALREAGGATRRATPGPPQESVAPALSLHMQTIRRAAIAPDGTLEISFEDDRLLTVAPEPKCEAWQLTAPGVGMVVCVPGGELAWWAEDGARTVSSWPPPARGSHGS